jgi:uncharacterized GH25 family protein
MFTLEQVRTTLAEVVAEKGEGFVYEDVCAYVVPENYNEANTTWNPSCIVGQVIDRLDPEALDRIRGKEWNFVPITDTQELWTKYSFGVVVLNHTEKLFEPEAVRYLEKAQNLQDSRYPYGEVLHAAEISV